MNSQSREILRVEDELALWIDQSVIMLKLLREGRDPVELTEDSARLLANALLQLADQVKAEDEG